MTAAVYNMPVSDAAVWVLYGSVVLALMAVAAWWSDRRAATEDQKRTTVPTEVQAGPLYNCVSEGPALDRLTRWAAREQARTGQYEFLRCVELHAQAERLLRRPT